MPSLGGPPERISLYGTECLLKSVLNWDVAPEGSDSFGKSVGVVAGDWISAGIELGLDSTAVAARVGVALLTVTGAQAVRNKPPTINHLSVVVMILPPGPNTSSFPDRRRGRPSPKAALRASRQSRGCLPGTPPERYGP